MQDFFISYFFSIYNLVLVRRYSDVSKSIFISGGILFFLIVLYLYIVKILKNNIYSLYSIKELTVCKLFIFFFPLPVLLYSLIIFFSGIILPAHYTSGFIFFFYYTLVLAIFLIAATIIYYIFYFRKIIGFSKKLLILFIIQFIIGSTMFGITLMLTMLITFE